MVIDVNAHIGHYPFRRTKHKTAADLVGLMDKYGVDKSCAASINAIYYKDSMQGNYELLDEIAPFADRLLPFCVINPEYNRAKEDFIECVDKLGFKGLRLYPKQHAYKLDGELSVELMRIAAEKGVPVHIPILLEDMRGHHALDVAVPLDAEEIKRAALSSPGTDIMLSNEYLQYYARVIEPACKDRPGGVYYDIGRVDCIYLTSLRDLVREAGYGRLLFGTGAPLQNMAVQFVKLHYMQAIMWTTPEQIEAITSGNAARVINL